MMMLSGRVLELKALVRADEMLGARQLGDHRVAAGGDQDRLGADRLVPVGKPHRVVVFERGAGEMELDPGLFERPRIDAIQPVDLAMHVTDKRRPVEAKIVAAPAETARVGKGARIAAAIDEQFLRHAAADHAGAADAIFLGDGHLGAELRSEPAGAHASRACADHEEIVVVTTHLTGSAVEVARRCQWPR